MNSDKEETGLFDPNKSYEVKDIADKLKKSYKTALRYAKRIDEAGEIPVSYDPTSERKHRVYKGSDLNKWFSHQNIKTEGDNIDSEENNNND